MNVKIISLIFAISLTVSLGFVLPLMIDRFNDATFGSITILNEPPLLKALKDVQSKGVRMGVHGWRHENFSAMTPTESKEAVEKSLAVFKEAGLIPVAFLSPYDAPNSALPPSVTTAIESTGIPTSLPRLKVSELRFGDYGWDWRDMKNLSDPRFEEGYRTIMEQQPTFILLHVQDWNPYLKHLISDYLEETHQANVTVRVDDIEVNTPAEKVYDMSGLLNYSSVGLLAYGVIPSGTWRGGDPAVFGISVNSIMKFYWSFFLLTAFFPFSFFVFWRFTSKPNKKDNAQEDPSTANPNPEESMSVSIIVPAYNEEKEIGNCIEAILKQDYKGEIETIVINDGSSDKTAEITSRYPVKLIDFKDNIGKANSLNLGIKKAKGNILVFSDSDSRMSNNAVSSLVNTLEQRQDVAAVSGNIFVDIVDSSKSLFTYFQAIEYRLEQEINRFLQGLNGNVLVCPGPLFAVRRPVAEEIMFSSKSVIEDADFTIEILKRHLKVIRDPKAKVYTDAPKSLASWFTQRKRWWYGNLQLWKVHKQWERRNPWTVLNYLGFITSTTSLGLMILLPFFFLAYDNIALMLLRGIAYAVTPMILFILFAAPFFAREKKLATTLIPYAIVYSAMKVIVVSYIYIRYLFRRGIGVVFGPHTVKVK